MPEAASPAVSMPMVVVIFKGMARKKRGNWTSILKPEDGSRCASTNASNMVDVSNPIRFESGMKRLWSFIINIVPVS